MPADLAVDLPPLGPRIDADLQVVELQRPVARLGRLRRCRPGTSRPSGGRASSRRWRTRRTRSPSTSFSALRLVQVEPVDGPRRRAAVAGAIVQRDDRRPFDEEDRPRLAGEQADVVLRRHRQRERPLVEVLEVDLHLRRVLRSSFLSFSFFLSASFFSFSSSLSGASGDGSSLLSTTT